jgi:hypothetical protein
LTPTRSKLKHSARTSLKSLKSISRGRGGGGEVPTAKAKVQHDPTTVGPQELESIHSNRLSSTYAKAAVIGVE